MTEPTYTDCSDNLNPNGSPMGCVIDVYLKNRTGPRQPFKRWEARRYAVEQVRHEVVEEVLRD